MSNRDLEPLGEFLLVEPQDPEAFVRERLGVSPGGLELAGHAKSERPNRGRVLKVGPDVCEFIPDDLVQWRQHSEHRLGEAFGDAVRDCVMVHETELVPGVFEA